MTEAAEISNIARRIAEETGGFTGGSIELFESAGRFTLKSMLQAGLRPEHRVLDLGCGVLRVGYWLIRFLDPDRYFGLEKHTKYVEIGLKHAVGPELQALKRPQFHIAENFDFSPFGVRFDFVVARSIFSHASLRQIGLTMDSFRDSSAHDAIMLASYSCAKDGHKAARAEDRANGREWMMHKYTLDRMQQEARERQLSADHFGERFNNQTWLRIKHANNT